MITSNMVKDLRDRTCVSLIECKRALEKCNEDVLLAEGYLKYNGCAIQINPPEKYGEWVMSMAQKWKEHLMEEENAKEE